VKEASTWVDPLRQEVGRVIVGQKYLIDRLLIALIQSQARAHLRQLRPCG
jgi:hypothetical protein